MKAQRGPWAAFRPPLLQILDFKEKSIYSDLDFLRRPLDSSPMIFSFFFNSGKNLNEIWAKKGFSKKLQKKFLKQNFFCEKFFFHFFSILGVGNWVGFSFVSYFFERRNFHRKILNFRSIFRNSGKCKHHENVQGEYLGHLTSFDTHMWYTGYWF